MPYWEDELNDLLESLGVTSENQPERAQTPQAELAPGDIEAEQISLVNHEMQATVQEVTQLVRAGHLDPALRDDIMHVLRALVRPAPNGTPDRAEWQLTSAAAVLHFCRVALRMAHAVSHQDC
jgi:hypothetical protein